MVTVGDKVIVGPLYGQGNNQVILSGGGGGIAEGEYTTWAHVWTNDFTDGLNNKAYQDHYIDEKNDILYLAWRDNASVNERFALYNLSDFSSVFESSSAINYPTGHPFAASKNFNFGSGLTDLTLSHSIQSYLLLQRYDGMTIEVWRGGASYVWSHNIQTEVASDYAYTFSISTTGKYILVVTSINKKIILYKGSTT